MATSARTCPDCSSELPAVSAFCPTCGARTPQATAGATGEIVRPPVATGTEDAHRARLQRALGTAWEIRRLIGRGGFAEVYGVWDVHLRREVAVKTLRHDIEVSAQMIQRFKREAESVARLRHPNIVPIYQVGEGEGLVYFIMPVIDGESLAGPLVRGESFSIPDTCRILREVAGALGAAHRTGVVHRDVKPDNIMLEGPERRAVVMDFGIAKLADAAEARLTGTGLLIGSPHYMSPEQAAGETELDHRSDEYSLGVVAFQMLAGRMPFEATSVQSILFKQMTEVPPPVTDVRPDVPPALAAALARALAKKPEERFQTMEEFAAAIPSMDGGARATSRRVLDLRTRTNLARATIAKWRVPAMVALAVGVIATVAGHVLTVTSSVQSMALHRDDAVFAAKTALQPLGIPPDAKLNTTFVREDSLYRLLAKSLGSRQKADSAGSALGLWRWRTDLYNVGLRTMVSADIAPGGHIVSYALTENDTVSRPSMSLDSSRVAAEAALVARGWTPSALHFVRDSTVNRRARTDRMFFWDQPIPNLKIADTAGVKRQIEVRLHGNRVTNYRERVMAPASAFDAPRNGTVKAVATGAMVILACGGALLAIILIIGRSRVDEVQWRPVGVFTTVIAIPLILGVAYAQSVPGDVANGASPVASLITGAIGLAVLISLAIIPFAAAESILAEHRPAAVAGMGDVARGKLMIPELVTAAFIGYPVAFLMFGASRLVTLGTYAVAGRGELSTGGEAATSEFPALLPFGEFSGAIMFGLLLAYALSLGTLRKLPAWIALIIPAAFVLAAGVTGNKNPVDIVIAVAIAIAFTAILWNFGFFTAIVAMFVYTSLDGLLTLLLSGDANHLMAGAVYGALLAVPAVIALLAHRRVTARPP